MLAAKRCSFPLKLPHPPQNPRIAGWQVKINFYITCKNILFFMLLIGADAGEPSSEKGETRRRRHSAARPEESGKSAFFRETTGRVVGNMSGKAAAFFVFSGGLDDGGMDKGAAWS
ncbi:hypothetical protein [uncultured Desulfovibrio sp.]|uniref:hypothetical protein n=1 Tax=uncultured Desulfovibrio sp. TaxID=167968 RepID=UPI00261C2DF4|nr:hypothetical protein [uncultured Desulfovibrio sp.]